MAKMKQVTLDNHTDHPYENGAIDAIFSVASVGAAVGGALGVLAIGIHGMFVGMAIGITVGALGAVAAAEKMKHPDLIISPKKIAS